MKKYVDNFMQYRFLLSELVKKGIKLKFVSSKAIWECPALAVNDFDFNAS